ncbi:MAG: hypothetical protein AAF739_10190 [Pseudomonadota bacterium]
MEETIEVVGRMPDRDKSAFLDQYISTSIAEAAKAGRSLALIKPSETHFSWRAKSAERVAKERARFTEAAKHKGFFDADLAAIEPTPYEFRFRFTDDSGPHDFANADWEAHAMFYNHLRRTGSHEATLQWMEEKFNGEYAQKGMLFCVGNVASRPNTWQLLGVLRVDQPAQPGLVFN